MNETNDKQRILEEYQVACRFIREELVKRVCAEGYACTITAVHACDRVTTSVDDASGPITAYIDVRSSAIKRRFTYGASLPVCIKIEVQRQQRPVTYTCDLSTYTSLNWKKIVACHIGDVKARVAHVLDTRARVQAAESVHKIENSEVPIPPEILYGPIRMGRKRRPDGTYDVTVVLFGVNVDVVKAMRDLVLSFTKQAS
jgi:hypothetical protein